MNPTHDKCAAPDCPTRKDGKWTQCDDCEEWHHYYCVGWRESFTPEGDFSCRKCRQQEKKQQRDLIKQLAASNAQLTTAIARPAQGPTWWAGMTWDELLPRFEGKDYESPTEFLKNCQSQLTKDAVPEDQWVRLVLRQLKGTAQQWWGLTGSETADWPTFHVRLIARFDDISILATLRAQYYGYRNTTEEPETFLAIKIKLHRRLFPNETETMAIPYLVEMLNDQVRPFLRNPLPSTFEALMTQTRQRANDLYVAHGGGVVNRQQCFHCGAADHYIRACPHLHQEQKNERMGPNGGKRSPSDKSLPQV